MWLKLALAPVLLAQGWHTRRTLPRLPEAAGPRSGTAGAGASGPGLLIVGDSSAAGVGVAHQRQALVGQLVHPLAAALGCRVHWQLCARSGANSGQLVALLADAAPAELAVVISGVNDVLDQVAPARAMRQRAELMAHLRQALGVRHVVLTPVPPMHRFSGLPQPLRAVLGRDAAAHERALQAWVRAQPSGISQLPLDLPMDDASLLASDGFHPGATLYARWGAALARHLVDRWQSDPPRR